jgi:hypothetical protein
MSDVRPEEGAHVPTQAEARAAQSPVPGPLGQTTGPLGDQRSGWGSWVSFAGVMMLMVGAFQGVIGLVALLSSDSFRRADDDLLVPVDYGVWGVVHLALGVLLVAAAVALFNRRAWGRVVAVVLAGLTALVELAFLAAHPLWSLAVIALAVTVIYAVLVHGDEVV